MYQDIMSLLSEGNKMSFEEISERLIQCIQSGTRTSLLEALKEIGTIPEWIPHDSTEEKLFSKASDAVLSRAFQELGMKSTVLRERGDAADVFAQSPIHGYTLVADAKAFRMSRTAKNQKDFKVSALSVWKKDADYAVLCAPYFQYPAKASQIYAQALEYNVCLFSWEHLIFLLENGIRESEDLNLSALWNFSEQYSHDVLYAERKNSFMNAYDCQTVNFLHLDWNDFHLSLNNRITEIKHRGELEIGFWEDEIKSIQQYSREQAVRELIEAKKIHQKIAQIRSWIRRLQT